MQRRGLVVQRGPWLETPRDAARKGIPLAQIDRQYQYKQQYGVMDSPQTITPESPATAPAEQPVTIINNYQSAPEEYAAPIAPETCLPGYTYSASLGYCVRNINYYGCIPGVEFWDPVSQTCSRNWPVCSEGGVNDLNTGVCIYPAKPELPVASYETFKALTNTTMTKEQYDAQVAAGNAPRAGDNQTSPPLTGEMVTRPALLKYQDYQARTNNPLSYYQYKTVATFYIDKWLAEMAKQSTTNSFFSKNLLPTTPVAEEISYPSVVGATSDQVVIAYQSIKGYAESNGTVTVDKSQLYDIGSSPVTAGTNPIEEAIGALGSKVDTFKQGSSTTTKDSTNVEQKRIGIMVDTFNQGSSTRFKDSTTTKDSTNVEQRRHKRV